MNFGHNHKIIILFGIVVEWLKRRAREQHDLGSKTHSGHSVVSLGKTIKCYLHSFLQLRQIRKTIFCNVRMTRNLTTFY